MTPWVWIGPRKKQLLEAINGWNLQIPHLERKMINLPNLHDYVSAVNLQGSWVGMDVFGEISEVRNVGLNWEDLSWIVEEYNSLKAWGWNEGDSKTWWLEWKYLEGIDFCWYFGMYHGICIVHLILTIWYLHIHWYPLCHICPHYIYIWYSLCHIYLHLHKHLILTNYIYIRIQYFQMLMFVCCNCRRFDIAKNCTTLRNTNRDYIPANLHGLGCVYVKISISPFCSSWNLNDKWNISESNNLQNCMKQWNSGSSSV